MCTECMVGMYSAYRNVLYNELGWKPSFFCFKIVLFLFLFCFLYYNFGVLFVAVFWSTLPTPVEILSI